MAKLKWIASNKKKPVKKKKVLVYAPNCNIIGKILIGIYWGKESGWSVYDFHDTNRDELVTHWMPLPKKP